MAFAAQMNTIPLVAWVLYLAVILWALVYDTMYAMVDKDDDLKIGVKSTAILFGNYDRHIMGVLQCVILMLLLIVGELQNLGNFYYLSLLIATSFCVYQQKLIFYREKTACFRAFLNNNWFGLVIFLGLLANYQLSSVN